MDMKLKTFKRFPDTCNYSTNAKEQTRFETAEVTEIHKRIGTYAYSLEEKLEEQGFQDKQSKLS